MKIEGTRHCGYVTFAAEIDPSTAAICHCTDCQTLSGSAFRQIWTRSRVSWLDGLAALARVDKQG